MGLCMPFEYDITKDVKSLNRRCNTYTLGLSLIHIYSLVVSPPLFAVADGMGGHAAGEVASEIAVNVLAEQAPAHPDANALGNAVVAANRAVLQGVHEGVGREGMGTTCTAAMLEGERLVIAQVGDSRAYLLHQGKLQQLTRDHSLICLLYTSCARWS